MLLSSAKFCVSKHAPQHNKADMACEKLDLERISFHARPQIYL